MTTKRPEGTKFFVVMAVRQSDGARLMNVARNVFDDSELADLEKSIRAEAARKAFEAGREQVSTWNVNGGDPVPKYYGINDYLRAEGLLEKEKA